MVEGLGRRLSGWMSQQNMTMITACFVQVLVKDDEGPTTLKKGHFDQNITIFSPKLNQTSTRVLLHETDFLFF